MTAFKKYWIFTVIGTMLASVYPLFMGGRVIWDMATRGFVLMERYPKYIIPYTPISVAIVALVLLMPLVFRFGKRFAFLFASLLGIGIFFIAELILEGNVLVGSSKLVDWQMFSCYVPRESFGSTWINVLIGEYSPTFKIHFYLISVILIVAILNCLYGFAEMLRTGNRSRFKALVMQSVCTGVFLGLCILACFTAFFRDGELTVSPLSAFLMCLFFLTMGITAGVWVGSFLLGKKKRISALIPSLTASFITLLMYVGEMFLLSGHLYRFGIGFLFDSIPMIVLAPIDICIIALSGGLTYLLCHLLSKTPSPVLEKQE